MPQWHILGRPALTPADRLHNIRHALLSDVSNDGDFQKRRLNVQTEGGQTLQPTTLTHSLQPPVQKI